MLHEEARLAHELAGPLGQDAVDRVAAVVDLDLLVLLVVFLLGADEAVLQDRVEVGLDVVGLDEILVVVLLFRTLLRRGDRGSVVCLGSIVVRVDDLDIDVVLVVEDVVVRASRPGLRGRAPRPRRARPRALLRGTRRPLPQRTRLSSAIRSLRRRVFGGKGRSHAGDHTQPDAEFHPPSPTSSEASLQARTTFTYAAVVAFMPSRRTEVNPW